MRKIYLTLVVVILVSSCSKKEHSISSRNYNMVKNCIEQILQIKENIDIRNCYLVNPYLDSLSLKYFSEETKKLISKELGWNEDTFTKVLKNNTEYSNKFYKGLIDLSKCNESHFVITFSSFDDNVLFVKLVDSYEKVSLENLKTNLKIHPSQVDVFCFIFDKNHNIVDFNHEVTFYE